ncbi:YgdI/YgdR family lipoprotein [Shimwellia pseudoproteus]|uniref:YgdI/YgdR family lipoprotein n=1 Tax=Shimwellia pseudoproteus TaxID=570012 RepID=UPI0018EBFBC6|nr:YgdI/YgdR family lipoprotein [Shimwellia pseudoproteus]MBJ3813817.1 YgdI/YgdR family lipoprotein [Shimwellia pseudoproteus]
MNKTIPLIAACLMTLSLAACSGQSYLMHTSDGRTIVTEGKPQTDSQTGMISYKDAWGNKQQINRSDVKEMTALED